MWHWQQTLGGINVPVPKTSPLFPYHDQLARDNFTNIGGSMAWEYSDSSSFSLSYMTSIMGRNGHKPEDIWAVSYAYEFGRH
jgi:hypothetical protein